MKKKCLLLIMLLILPFITSCNNTDPIKIGFSNELNPYVGTLGFDLLYGAELAVEEINDKGGVHSRMIELIVRDDESDAQKAIDNDNELKELGCVAIIGHTLSSIAKETIENAEANDILLISPTISTSLYENIDDNFIRLMPTASDQGESLANLVLEEHNGETIVIYEETNQVYSKSVADSFVAETLKNGITINPNDILSFEGNNIEDYIEISDYINNSPIENILIIGSSFDVGSIVQLLDNVAEKDIFLPIWPATSDIFALSGGKIEGAHAINFYDSESSTESYLNFSTSYDEKYGEDISFASIFAYESVMVLYEALLVAESFTTADIKAAIIAIEEFEGINGNFRITEYGDVVRDLLYFHLTDNKFVRVNHENIE
ncbi:ABC transporter substrate-binding protein [Candidatus Izimaplasma bacterium]|nr:ABC transporter substrate-binding protein [Candidatus Izimaplasma bacterium]